MLALRLTPSARSVQVSGNHIDLTPLTEVREAENVFVYGSMDLTDLTPLASLPRLKHLVLSRCSAVRDLTPLAGTWDKATLTATTWEQMLALRLTPSARSVQVSGNHIDLTPLTEVREAENVFVYGSMDLTDLTPLASLPRLKHLVLSRCSAVRDLTP
ncbi:leucine-rich repeat domain-containing protein, partial [Streptomyces sp. YS-3]|uniref:leucine-rich repeat domain-containing protein n=1 Tax=Streptomyces sp. YS-3 TaxID=3381352 RepID=UPI00386269DD